MQKRRFEPRLSGKASAFVARLLVVFVLFSTAALADDFTTRVAEAKKALSTPQGKQYDDGLRPTVDAAIRICVPPGSSSEAKLGKFELVGYVEPSGFISSVAVQPKTEVSLCFAAELELARLAPPPESDRSASGFPITVEMTVLP